MFKLRGAIKRVNKDESGAALAEYSVLLIICAVAGVGGVVLLGGSIGSAFSNMSGWVTSEVVGKIK
ncbi:MAG: Flp family type IVb pilin [Beijerinckiaceae bacterium]